MSRGRPKTASHHDAADDVIGVVRRQKNVGVGPANVHLTVIVASGLTMVGRETGPVRRRDSRVPAKLDVTGSSFSGPVRIEVVRHVLAVELFRLITDAHPEFRNLPSGHGLREDRLAAPGYRNHCHVAASDLLD